MVPWVSCLAPFPGFEVVLGVKENHGKEEQHPRELFYALWVPDLFMERAQSKGQWSLFCPNEAPGLADCWGDEFEKLCHQYEKEGTAWDPRRRAVL
ncbi:hypothetical protein VNO77_19444 [Canavalia gladiata]|uniref:Ribonucleotide reductase large subunit C-terminal domain-containing protein n=1 Tax=Canavalia gladiata TaxID=3824 RepID=A0AAN9LRJ5_CANGL